MNQTGHDTIQLNKTLPDAEMRSLMDTLRRLLTSRNMSAKLAVRTDGLDWVLDHRQDSFPPVVISERGREREVLLLDICRQGWVITTTPKCKRIIDVRPVQACLKSTGETDA